MQMKFRLLAALLVTLSLLNLTACSTGSSTPAGNGVLFVATQGDNSVAGFRVDLNSGSLSANGKSLPTGAVPSAMAIPPSNDALFIANTGSNYISAYSLNSDGILTATSGTT